MDGRKEYLTKLQLYTEEVDEEITMILNSLQWDKNHLLQHPVMVSCAYNPDHKMPPDKIDEHERQCFFSLNGYTRDELLLPDPPDTDGGTLVKLSKEDIVQIIENAARSDPMFKKGVGSWGAEPMSLARLQAAYTADERRAIHDAVVSAVPSCHDLADLALPGEGDKTTGRVILSRFEILAELRNMRRRRTKYRVAAKTRNYSDVLRDVIKTQMEHYNVVKTEPVDDTLNSGPSTSNTQLDRRGDTRESYRSQPRIMPKPIVEREIKTEREDSRERDIGYSRERSNRDRRYEDRGRMGRDTERSRHRYNERRHDNNRERAHRYEEVSPAREDRSKDRHRNSRRLDRNDNHERGGRYREKRYDRYRDRRYDDSHRDHHHETSNSSRQRTELENRVKKEPGIDESTDRIRDRRRRSRERRYSSDSYQGYDYEERDHHREPQVKREPGTDETRKEISKDTRYGEYSDRSRDRHSAYYEHEERSNERIHIKQERQDSPVTEGDRSSDRSGKEYYDTYEKSKNSHKSKDKKRKRHSYSEFDEESDRSDRHRQESREKPYIKQEEESPTREDSPRDKHRKKKTKKHKKSKKDSRDTQYPEYGDRHKEKSKQTPNKDDYRQYKRSKDYKRDQRHDRDRRYSGSSYCSCSAEERELPASNRRYSKSPSEAEYDPHKKIKVEK
ncbi:unnamed protein product [Chrysodeixis includens]|uniref:Uncharacterized protein n=1 Tax=Chrysodeixis includens TaxID=689277 RepID=A0A9P0FZ76_CHRIL|nr:unnamed protein product [Chrysodeixis includens]